MKKIALLLAMILILSQPLSAQSVHPRAITVYPEICVNGDSGTCHVTAVADNMSEYLEAKIKIYRDNIWIGTWNETGYGYILFSEDIAVLSGSTYKLVVDVKVDGVAIPRATAIYEPT